MKILKLLILLLLLCAPAGACELLVKAQSAALAGSGLSAAEDQAGRTKRGMIVVIMPDGHVWGDQERLPKYAVIKIPGVSVDRAWKYIAAQLDLNGAIIRARLWQLRWDDMPAAARNKLANGGLTIKIGDYTGPYDYTWAQVKGFFRNLETGLDETEDL